MEQKEMQEILSEFSTKVAEKLEMRQKQANFADTANAKVNLEGAKQLSLTGEFFKAVIEDRKADAIAISKKSWGNNYYKALNTTTDAAIVPTIFSTEIIKRLPDYSVIRANSRVREMAAKTVSLNELTARVSAGKVSELSNLTSSKNTYTAPTVTAEDYWAGAVMSMQIEADNEINLLADLRDEFARAIAQAEQFSFLNSVVTGSEGIMTATGTSVYVLGGATNSGRDTFAEAGADDVEKAVAQVRQLNVGNANFKLFIASDVLAAISAKVVSGVGYQEMMKIGYVNGRVATIAGLPVVEVTGANSAGTSMLPKLSDSAVTTDFAFIADLNNSFIIGDRMGVEMELQTQGNAVDELGATINLNMTGGKFLRAIKRTGQKVVRAAEIIKLRTSTT